MMTEPTKQPNEYHTATITKNRFGDVARAEYFVDQHSNLVSDVTVEYVPYNPSEIKRIGAIKVPIKFIKQLQTMPLELWGVPLEVLVKLAHKIKESEGTSVLEITKKIILPDA